MRLFAAALALMLTVASQPAHLAAAAAPVKGTEILWDTWGIAHIFAPDHPSLFYAYGYAQMEAHSELLLRLYAQARGRGAEIYGEQYLEADRWVRTNGLPARAKEWAKGQTPQFGPLIASFVDGLNAWAKEHPSELSAEAKQVLDDAGFAAAALELVRVLRRVGDDARHLGLTARDLLGDRAVDVGGCHDAQHSVIRVVGGGGRAAAEQQRNRGDGDEGGGLQHAPDATPY